MRQSQHTFFRRLGALLLCLALLAGLLPTAALAAGTDTGKAIQIGASGISGYDSTNGYDYIYYGEWNSSPIKWRVLDTKTNMANATEGDGLFLLSDVLLGTGADGGVYFQQNYHSASGTYHKGSAPTDGNHTNCQIANVWQGSDAQAWCKDFAGEEGAGSAVTDAFTADELGAILATTKSDNEFISGSGYNTFAPSNDILNGDKVFFLSVEEAETSGYGFGSDIDRKVNYGSSAGNWWLRSPYAHFTNYAGLVDYNGKVDDINVYSDRAARPAFNLNLNSVLFTSAAVGGKSKSGMDNGLTAVDNYNGNEWKLTLLDSNRSSFTALATETSATTQAENYSGWTVEVTYSGAQTGSKEYVSAMLVDGSGSVLYYGRVANNSANGTASITIPDGLAAGNYTLKVFSEQYNGDKITDYASAFEDIDLHVHGWSDTWNSDVTYHWHDCTAAGCPITDNSQKDGYAEHVYDQQVATDSYLVSPATCTQAATYYKSCSCGAKGTETFTSGNPTGHTPEAEWQHDGNTHWNECASCGIKLNEAAHVYDDGQDDTCNACEYVRTTYTLTINLNNGSGSSTGGKYAEGTVVNIDAGTRTNYRFTSWTSSNGGTFDDASSANTTFTMPAADTTITANWQYDPPYIPPTKPDGPSTGTSDGWEDIVDELADAEDGDTITIDMGDETEVPGEIFEEVAGKDVTVEIELDGGVTWTVNGQDVPTGTDFTDLDLGVDLGTSGISVDVINTVTGELGSVQITLAHNGEFGFALTLTAPLGKENKGLWANLYHYDEDAKALNYEASAQIDDEGDVALRMTHASQYAIVIDDKSHDLPFTDLGKNQWYESAVRYAYTHGIMEGTSATTFVPGKSLTRAEAVQVLYNLEGQPEVSGTASFPDLMQEWYKPAIAWAESTGVVDGYEDGTFRPDQPVNRMEFAQMLYNYAKYKGCDLTAEGDLSAFPDGDSVQKWALPAMTWANGNALINGHDDGTLEPAGTTTRAQAAAILMRFDQKLAE